MPIPLLALLGASFAGGAIKGYGEQTLEEQKRKQKEKEQTAKAYEKIFEKLAESGDVETIKAMGGKAAQLGVPVGAYGFMAKGVRAQQDPQKMIERMQAVLGAINQPAGTTTAPVTATAPTAAPVPSAPPVTGPVSPTAAAVGAAPTFTLGPATTTGLEPHEAISPPIQPVQPTAPVPQPQAQRQAVPAKPKQPLVLKSMTLDKTLQPTFSFGPQEPTKPELVQQDVQSFITHYQLPEGSPVNTRVHDLLTEVYGEADVTKRLRGLQIMETALENTKDLWKYPEFANDEALLKKLIPSRGELAQAMAGPSAEEKENLKVANFLNLPADSALGKWGVAQFHRIETLTSDKEVQDALHAVVVSKLDKNLFKNPDDEAMVNSLPMIGIEDLKQAQMMIGQRKQQAITQAQIATAQAIPQSPPTEAEFALMWNFKEMRPPGPGYEAMSRSTLMKEGVRKLTPKDFEALEAQNVVLPFIDQLRGMIEGGALKAETIPEQVMQKIMAGQPISVPLDPQIAPYVGMLGLAARYIYKAVTTDVGNISGTEGLAGFAALGGPGFSAKGALAQLDAIEALIKMQGKIMQAQYLGHPIDRASFVAAQRKLIEKLGTGVPEGRPVPFTPLGGPTTHSVP